MFILAVCLECVSRVNGGFALKMMNFAFKMMNFVFKKTDDFALKMMTFAFTMMNLVFKMMKFGSRFPECQDERQIGEQSEK